MAESLYIVNLGLQNPDGMSTPRYKIHALKVIDEQMVGRFIAVVRHFSTGPVCEVLTGVVNESHRRRRFGHEIMFELERRWPGVTTVPPTLNETVASTAHWFANRAAIMAANDPHLGRTDLPAYTPLTLPPKGTP